MNNPYESFSSYKEFNPNIDGLNHLSMAKSNDKPEQKYKENFISRFKKSKKPQGKFTNLKK